MTGQEQISSGGESTEQGGATPAAEVQQRGTQLEDVQALQEQLNRARADAAKYRTQLREMEKKPGVDPGELQSLIAQAVEAALKPLQDKLQTVEGDLGAERKARRETELKLIQAEYNLPDELMNRLQGETVQDLRQDAERLAKTLQGMMPKSAILSPTNPVADGEQGAAALATRIFQMRRGGLADGLNLVGDLLDGRNKG